jgi:hypothetical protein
MSLNRSNFNISPYYDDFNESKKFLQVLFKPGYSIQARELTQLQSILSNQVGRFADHIFENGDVIKGGGITETKIKFIRLDNSGDSATVNIKDLIGYDLEYTHTVLGTSTNSDGGDGLAGTTTKVVGKVVHAEEATTDDPYKILFVDITKETKDNSIGFPAGTSLITSTNLNINPSLKIKEEISGEPVVIEPTGSAILISIDTGIFYVDGYFVMNDQQSAAISELDSTGMIRKFNPVDRTVSVGFFINREIDTATTDVSLRDPSQGSYNYNAPGADRFLIKLEIKQIPYVFDEQGYRTDKDTDNYFEWARIIKGETFKKLKYPEYAQLEETLARRTYDESGHYTVRAFGIETIDYEEVWDPEVTGRESPWEYCAVGMKTGKAYVRGYEFELQNTEHLVGKKARTTIKHNDKLLDVDFGNYVLCEHNMDGTTPIFQIDGAMNNNTMNLVGGSSIPEWKKVNLTIEGANGELLPVGCARIFQIAPHAFNAGTLGVGTIYRIYLNDVIFGEKAGFDSSANLLSMKDVAYLSDPLTGKKLLKPHIPSGQTQNDGLQDKGQNGLVFQVPAGEVTKQIRGFDYYIQRDFTYTLSHSGGIWSATINAPTGVNFQGQGVIDDITNIDEYMVSVDGYLFDMNAASTGDYGGNQLVGNASGNQVEIQLSSTATDNWDTSTTKQGYCLANMRINAEDGEVSSNEAGNIRKKILKRHTATITNTSNADGAVGMWNKNLSNGWGVNLGYPDVFQIEKVTEIGTGTEYTDKFTLKNNQKAYMYDHSYVVLDRSNVGGTGGIENAWAQDGAGFKVTFLYWDHRVWDTGEDSTDYTTLKYPLCVNSYVHNDHEVKEFNNDGVTANFGGTFDNQPYQLSTFNFIPEYSDNKKNITLDLTDCLDFRPIKVGKWDTNHPEFGKVRGCWTPQDGKLFYVDYETYLPRVDKIVLTRDREFRIIEGIPAEVPVAPEHNQDSEMALYELFWNPYTYTCEDVKPKELDIKRYTMEDIGDLEERIVRLEETTTLEKEETDTKAEAATYGDKFTNAMQSDGFKTMSTADSLHPEYNVAMDDETGSIVPAQSMTNIDLSKHMGIASSDGITSSPDNIYYLTPSSVGISTVNNLTANTPIYPNPFSKTNWVGNLRISPSSDQWYSMVNQPVVTGGEKYTVTQTVKVRRKSRGIGWYGWGAWRGWAGRTHWNWNNQLLNRWYNPCSTRYRYSVYNRFRGWNWNNAGRWYGNRYASLYRSGAQARVCRNYINNQAIQAECRRRWRNTNCYKSVTKTVTKTRPLKTVMKEVKVKVRPKELTLTATNMKPNTRYYAFIDARPVGSDTSNKYGYVISSDNEMRTSACGNAEVKLQIPKENPYTMGKLLIRICDEPNNVSSLTTTSAETFFTVGPVTSKEAGISSTREISAKRDTAMSERITQDAASNSQGQALSDVADYFDPLAQVFEVDATSYPKGIMATSVDLFFREVDTSTDPLPFSIELRPIVNGAPHPTTIIPLSEVTKDEGILEEKTGPRIDEPNRFYFTSPLHLTAGKYALICKTNSTGYVLWGTEFGKKGLTADGTATASDVERQPYTGSMFQPQNNGSRFEDASKNIMFRLNRATFSVGAENILYLQGATAETENDMGETVYSPDFHEVQVLTEYTKDPITELKFYMPLEEGKFELQPNQETMLPKRRTYDLETQGSSDAELMHLTLSTLSPDVTPIVDMDRLSLVAARNEFSNNVANELMADPPEDYVTSVARYVGKAVNVGTEANIIRVSFQASIPTDCAVYCYAKCAVAKEEDMSEKDYVQLESEITNSSNPSATDPTQSYGYKYYYTKPEGFTDYQVKIVLAGDPTKSDVPKISRLKSFALYDADLDTSVGYVGDYEGAGGTEEETGGYG